MRRSVSSSTVLVLLVVTTAIDASRIFYLPLPKIHSSKQHIQPDKIIDETTKKPISDEFIPASAIEQEEIEKRGDAFDWEELVDREAAVKRRIAVNELRPASAEQLRERLPSDLLMAARSQDGIDTGDAFDNVLSANNDNFEDESWPGGSVAERAERLQSNAALRAMDKRQRRNNTLFFVIVGTCCMIGVVGLVAATVFWYKVQKRAKAADDAEYPSYGVTGPNSSGGGKISPSSTMSDRKLAQSAQMFHYQQQRQQMMAQEKDLLDAKANHSDDSDDEAPEGGDYTVYECPGLAPTGEMEVRNPLFAEPDSSIVIPPSNAQPSTSPPKDKLLP